MRRKSTHDASSLPVNGPRHRGAWVLLDGRDAAFPRAKDWLGSTAEGWASDGYKEESFDCRSQNARPSQMCNAISGKEALWFAASLF
jgi:hypothetical protein